MQGYDFSGWVTKNDILCSDGVVIKNGAFANHHNKKVPLVWNHNHEDPEAVLGHVILHSRDEGIYGYGFFNDTDEGERVKKLVGHGDIASMSIAANKVRKASNRRDVIHGNIYEVSLVLSGANPGAMIDNIIQHSDSDEESMIIYTDNLIHAAYYPDDAFETEDKENTEEMKHSEEEILHAEEQAAQDLANEIQSALTDDELKLVYKKAKELAGKDVPDEELMDALDDSKQEELTDYIMELLGSDEDDEENTKEETDVRHNVFDSQEMTDEGLLQHSMLMDNILEEAKACGSLKGAMKKLDVNVTITDLMHGISEYDEDTLLHSTIQTVDELLTVETFNNAPTNIKPEKDDVVNLILSGVTSTPKHTVRSRFADLTTDEARARGYIKGDEKIEEYLGTLQRVTYPQTIYKYQTIDNDDLIDIDWDVIGYLREEAKTMWRYELARAIIIGDGRVVGDRQRIKPENIRPIMYDDDFYTTKVGGLTVSNFLDKVVEAMAVSYKGNGTPIMFADKLLIARVKLQKATDGHYLFGNLPATTATLADLCGVKQIVEPDFMIGKGQVLIVSLKDYELAAPNKGKGQTYEDFDLKFNLHEYLMEGRCAGALVQPQAAIAFKAEEVTAETYTKASGVTEDNFASGTYYYKFGHVYKLASEFRANTTYYTKD